MCVRVYHVCTSICIHDCVHARAFSDCTPDPINRNQLLRVLPAETGRTRVERKHDRARCPRGGTAVELGAQTYIDLTGSSTRVQPEELYNYKQGRAPGTRHKSDISSIALFDVLKTRFAY